MKHLLLTMIVVLFLLSLPASAETEPVSWLDGDGETYNSLGEHFRYEIRDGEAVLTCYWMEESREQPPVIEVPAEMGGAPLTVIGWCAFDNFDPLDLPGGERMPYDGEKVERIVIPEGVTALEDGAFCEAEDVRAISLPSTLREIGIGVTFEHVTAEIDFPNGNPVYRTENGFLIDSRTEALLYCALSAEEEPLPPVRRIETSALDNYVACQGILEFPDTVEYIGSYNAYDSVDLKTIIIPGSVKEIADYGLFCNSAEKIILNEGLEKIGAYAFTETDAGTVIVPSTVTWIGCGAFDWEGLEPVLLNPDCVWETEEEYESRSWRKETAEYRVVERHETDLRLLELIDDGEGFWYLRVTMRETGRVFLSSWVPPYTRLDTVRCGDELLAAIPVELPEDASQEDADLAPDLFLTFAYDGQTWRLTHAAGWDWFMEVKEGRFVFNDGFEPDPAWEWTAEGEDLLTEFWFKTLLRTEEEYDRQKPDRPALLVDDPGDGEE